MELKKGPKPIWKAALSILVSSPEAEVLGRFFTAEDMAGLVNRVLGESGAAVTVEADQIVRAFSVGAGVEEYPMQLGLLGVGYDGDDILYVHMSKQFEKGANRVTAIGRFDSEEAAKVASINKLSIRNISAVMVMDDDLRIALVNHLLKKAMQKKKKKADDDAAKEKAEKRKASAPAPATPAATAAMVTGHRPVPEDGPERFAPSSEEGTTPKRQRTDTWRPATFLGTGALTRRPSRS